MSSSCRLFWKTHRLQNAVYQNKIKTWFDKNYNAALLQANYRDFPIFANPSPRCIHWNLEEIFLLILFLASEHTLVFTPIMIVPHACNWDFLPKGEAKFSRTAHALGCGQSRRIHRGVWGLSLKSCTFWLLFKEINSFWKHSICCFVVFSFVFKIAWLRRTLQHTPYPPGAPINWWKL